MFSNLKDTVFTGGTFNAAQGDVHHHNYFNGRKGMDSLYSSIAPGAFHNSAERYDPPRCHPATRIAVLQCIMKWINDLDKLCFFLWLYGPAGAGKSAIAQSIAELCQEEKILAASFFFSRTVVGRNDGLRLIPTIVYQLCISIPAIKKYVEDRLDQDPLILSRSLDAQLQGLIVEPLNHAFPSNQERSKSRHTGPRLIIIDGLDECGNGKVQRYILTVLAGAIKQLPFPLFFLVASRPEQDIRDVFNCALLVPATTRLALDDSYLPDNDIAVFLTSRFDDIKKNHPLRELLASSWPSAPQIQSLVQKSSGQFIYASTVMKYIDSPRHRPTQRLDIIFGITSPGNDTPFAELDALYLHIFSSIGEIDKVLKVLCALLLLAAQPTTGMTPYFVENLLFFERGDLSMILSDLHSIIDVPPINLSQRLPVRILHASLGDFLLDKSRAKTLHIDAEYAHASLASYLLKRISNANFSIQDSYKVAFYSALIPQCSLACPTEELLDELLKFDMLRFINSGTISSFWIMAHIPPLFIWMKKHDTSLYLHHIQSWDKHTRSRMSLLLRRSPGIALNFITSLLLPDFPTIVHDIKEILVDGLDVAIIDDFVDADDKAFCMLGFKYGPEVFVEYHLMISQFLDDPLRSKYLYVDGDAFTRLTIGFTNYLLKHSVSVPTEGGSFSRYGTALLYLPLCLSKSSPSKALATLLEGLELPSADPVKKKRVLEAINAYISRSTISDAPEVVFDTTALLATRDPPDEPNILLRILKSNISEISEVAPDNSAVLALRRSNNEPDEPGGANISKSNISAISEVAPDNSAVLAPRRSNKGPWKKLVRSIRKILR